MEFLMNHEPSWKYHQLGYEILQKFKKRNVMVYNDSLEYDGDVEKILAWINGDKKRKLHIISCYDPVNGFFQKKIKDLIKDNSRIKITNSKDFCFWLLATDRLFRKYTEDELLPRTFKYKFLCYQRKLREERELLWKEINNFGGIITTGDRDYSFINSEFAEHSGFHEIGEDDLYVKNDIYSLGNMDIWRESFLNIVSETIIMEDFWKKKPPFISEKTFKPIIGMRPFLIYGHPKSSEYIKNLGFEVFDDDFGYKPTMSINENVKQIKDIVKNIDVSMWDSLLPKIKHNKEWFNEAVKREWTKIDMLTKEDIKLI